MAQRTVDLSENINLTTVRGNVVDFPVVLRPIFHSQNGDFEEVPNRMAVIRQDSSQVLGVVSNRYRLIPHQNILDAVQSALTSLDVGLVPHGIYMDRGGARMRALFKFPSLALPVLNGDNICPCLKIQNTYDGTSRITVHIGGFRFVCTNLAVGGGGVFAGGFMSVHAGEIPLDEVSAQLRTYLSGFDVVVSQYRFWVEKELLSPDLENILESFPKRPAEAIRKEISGIGAVTVYDAYNSATRYATHRMRTYRTAFELLERINRRFQKLFPLPSRSQ